MFNRQMYPEVTDYDISVTVPLDKNGKPFVTQTLPDSWNTRGAIPLLIKAKTHDGTDVLLTPYANLTMTRLVVDDPFVIRLSKIALNK
jgi:hypothetical protein